MQKTVLVIGGGPAGYSAAETAAKNGADVVLFERERLGGTCGIWGCIPTKTLFSAAVALHDCERLSKIGVQTSAEMDFSLIKNRMKRVVGQTEKGVEFLMKKAGVAVVKGEAVADISNLSVTCNGEHYNGDALILASGSTEGKPGVFDVEGVWTSKDLLVSDHIPKSMLVIGAGAVGVEFASIYRSFGCEITLIEAMDRILPFEDEEISKTLKRSLKKQGIRVLTGSGVLRVIEGGEGVFLENGEEILGERVLLAIGRRVLSDFDVERDGRFIKVNSRMETSVPNVYAAGDIVGGKMLAHEAHVEGIVAGSNASGKNLDRYWKCMPSVTFSIPEVASVGLTEKEGACTGKFLYRALGKGLAEGHMDGLCKVVADKGGKFAGCHIIGHNASELIQEAVIAIESGLMMEKMAHMVHSHPTMPEIIMEACRDCSNKSS